MFFPITVPTSFVALGRSDYTTGSNPAGVATGDFNGDGKLDIAQANFYGNTVSVLLGNGDGTFQPHVNYATGIGPDSVVVGDFNRDGKLDLAVLSQGSNAVSVLLGNGDGTFQRAANYAAGIGDGSLAVGDFNGDGKQDLASTSSSSDTVSVLLGNGDGTFREHVDYATGSGPYGVGVGDFNRDGKLDLAVADMTGGTISILLGNGDGTFQAHVDYATGSGANWVSVADLNADGILDLIVPNQDSMTVSILLGNGNGTFQPHVDYAVGAGANRSAVGDVNGDGKIDLVIGPRTASNVISILLGNGDGTFQVPVEYATGGDPIGVAVGDFNRDGRLDLAVADNGTSAVSVLLQAPTVLLSTTTLTFGDHLVGSSSNPQTVTLINTGYLTLKVTDIKITGSNANDFSHTNTCPSALPPGSRCSIEVTFMPTQIGPRTTSVTITDNAVDSPQSVALSGTGVVSGPNVTLSNKSLTFATQLVGTTSTAQSVTLSNYGTVALNISSINVTGSDPGDFIQTNTCGGLVASGASCTISVTFKPTQGGTRTAALSIIDNGPGSPQTVLVRGVGTVVQLSPASLSFGNVPLGTSTTASTTLTNTGSTTLSITRIVIAGADTDEFRQTHTCLTGLGAGKSCIITVTFTPREKGRDSAEVSISDNDITSPQQVPLSGAGCVWEIINRHRKCVTTIARSEVQSTLAKTRTTVVPTVTGADRVGTRVLDLIDSTRIDPFGGNGINRELLVRFWYPASAEQDCKLADYTSPRVWNYFAGLTRLPPPTVGTNACLDAPVANSAHPVIVFTHGYTGTFTDYTFLVEDLASRGYIVVSIDHTYEATAVEFPDGRFVKSLVGSHLTNTWQTDDQTLSSALAVRLDDVKFVVDELERLSESTGTPFAGRFDLTRLALAGHSLGGLTAWFGVQRDARFRAAVLVDPYLPDIPVGSTGTPILLLTMGREQRNEDECQLWSDLRGPRLAVNLRGAEHVTPSDLIWLAKGAIKSGSMGPDRTIEALRDYIAAFLDTNVRGKPLDPLLTGPSSDFPDAEVTTQGQALCREP